MKKLIFVFVALFMLILISGCGARQNTIRYNNGEEVEVTRENPDEGETDEETDAETDAETEEETAVNTPTVTPSDKLAITSFDGAFLKTNLSYNVVKGTVPEDTYRITINEYGLQKYIPGSTQWDYIASTRFSTLKNGLNTYIVKTYDSEDMQTDSIIFSIDYDAPVIPDTLPGVGASHWLAMMATLILVSSYAISRRFRWL